MSPARLHHVCLAVTDLDAAVSELRDLGVELIGEPMAVPGSVNASRSSATTSETSSSSPNPAPGPRTGGGPDRAAVQYPAAPEPDRCRRR
jgi:catechol 2,3-dioxygenase-like lactoylglutathione lyase family enzyme